MKYIILDLDGCISDDRRRLHLIDHNEPDMTKRYEKYHSVCDSDPPINRHLFDSLDDSTTAVIFTARPQKYADQTIDWLEKTGIKFEILCMRKDGDHRPSTIIKNEFLSFIQRNNIIRAFDDKEDVVAMYRNNGISADIANHETYLRAISKPLKKQTSPDEVLNEMAKTFLARNSIYSDNYKMVPKMVAALFPHGVPSELVVEDHWHLFELKLVKLARFAASGLTHIDSIHDDAVYSAMIESILKNKEKK